MTTRSVSSTERNARAAVFALWMAAGVAHAQGGAAPHVFIDSEDRALVGFLAVAWVDEGWTVAPTRATATHEVRVTRTDDGALVARAPGVTREVRIAAGPEALMHLELLRRATVLVEEQPARAAPAEPLVSVRTTFRAAADPALREQLHAALLARGVALAPASRDREQLCVDVGADLLVLSWGRSCDGRAVALPRAGLVPTLVVGEALGLRDAAPRAEATRTGGSTDAGAPASSSTPPVSTAPPRAPATSAPSTSAPSTSPPAATEPSTSPLAMTASTPIAPTTSPAATSPPSTSAPTTSPAATSPPSTSAPTTSPPSTPTPSAGARAPTRLVLGVRGGAIGRTLAFDPLGALQLAWEAPLPVVPVGALDSAPRLGPSARVLATAGQPDALLTVVDVAPLVGARLAWPAGPVLVTATLEAGVWLHAWIATAEAATLRPAATAAAHLGVSWPVTTWLALDAEAGLGAIPVARIHVVAGEEVWRREAMFLTFSVGLAGRIPFVELPWGQ